MAGTKVVMGDGTSRAIEQVKVGALMLSRDEASGKVEEKKVLHLSVKHSIPTLKLTFGDGSVVETAGELDIGNAIVNRAGPSLKVAAMEGRTPQTVYNFEVDDFHTYFVGGSQVWVHNALCDDYGRPLQIKLTRC